jgi:hypothetical protein
VSARQGLKDQLLADVLEHLGELERTGSGRTCLATVIEEDPVAARVAEILLELDVPRGEVMFRSITLDWLT